MELTFTQKFEQEKYLRMIESCENIEDLRKISKMVLEAYFVQKAATEWAMRQSLPTRELDLSHQPVLE